MMAGVVQAGLAAWGVALVSLGAIRVGSLVLSVLAGAVTITPEFVVSVVAGAMALALEVVPGLKGRWELLPAELKRFAWLLGCLLVGVTPCALGCVSRALGVDLSMLWIVGSCQADTLARGMQVAFLAYFASQSVHGLSVAATKAASYYRNGTPQSGAV